MTIHDFAERLSFSEGFHDNPDMIEKLLAMCPNSTKIEKSGLKDDRSGTDYWIHRTHDLPPLSIDVKRRSFCPIEKYRTDDACVETTSVYLGEKSFWWKDSLRKKIGWTLDYRKRTDFICYTWPAVDGVRFWILPFVPLCKAARTNWRAWASEYGERSAPNKGYLTLSVYPERRVLSEAIKVLMSGVA